MNFLPLWRYQNQLIDGAIVTLELTVISALCGLLIGVAGAVALKGRLTPLRLMVRGYIELFRNTPSLIQIFIIFFVLPSFGLKLPAFESAAVALSLYFGAYSVEIIRAGLDSIPPSQVEAGQCLGLSGWQVFRHIVLPPALRNAYPALTSQFVLLMLASSVCSQISAEELTAVANYIQSDTYRAFETYIVVAVLYIILSLVMRAGFWGLGLVLFPRRRRLGTPL
jgi:polar amino acid transport system permease protein